MATTKIKASELREKTRAELLTTLKELKTELSSLRVAKVTGGTPNKLMKIRVVRKSIKRLLTIYREKEKKQVMEHYYNKIKEEKEIRKRIKLSKVKRYEDLLELKAKKVKLPKDLRPKYSRKLRRELPEAFKRKVGFDRSQGREYFMV